MLKYLRRRNYFKKNPTSHFSRQDVEEEAPELRNDMDYEDIQSTTEKVRKQIFALHQNTDTNANKPFKYENSKIAYLNTF